MARSPSVTSTPRVPRRITRRRIAQAGVLGLTGLLAGRGAIAAEPVASPAASPEAGQVSLLFVQDCESGRLAPIGGQTDAYSLMLHHGLGRTVYFSDRPQRFYGALPTGDFVANASFSRQNPPNAALVMQVSDTDVEVAVFELRTPRYDATAHVLTYEATLLTDFARQGMRLSKTPLTASALPATFGAASLFIDGERLNQKISVLNRIGRNIRIKHPDHRLTPGTLGVGDATELGSGATAQVSFAVARRTGARA